MGLQNYFIMVLRTLLHLLRSESCQNIASHYGHQTPLNINASYSSSTNRSSASTLSPTTTWVAFTWSSNSRSSRSNRSRDRSSYLATLRCLDCHLHLHSTEHCHYLARSRRIGEQESRSSEEKIWREEYQEQKQHLASLHHLPRVDLDDHYVSLHGSPHLIEEVWRRAGIGGCVCDSHTGLPPGFAKLWKNIFFMYWISSSFLIKLENGRPINRFFLGHGRALEWPKIVCRRLTTKL